MRWSVPDGDFAVLDAVSDEGEAVVLVGPLAHVRDGESLAVAGGWRRHARHGWQFQAERVRVLEPVGEHAVRAYLESIKHVGPVAAIRLVRRFGADEVLAAIDRDPERILATVQGIGPRRLGAAVQSWRDQRELRELRLFLDTHGVDAASAGRIARHFGAGSIARLQREPYAICELDGIGFADRRRAGPRARHAARRARPARGRRAARAEARRDRRPLPSPPRRARRASRAAARRGPHRPRDRRARRPRQGGRRGRLRRRRAAARDRVAPRPARAAGCWTPSRRCASSA